jgi:hypothetical protein
MDEEKKEEGEKDYKKPEEETHTKPVENNPTKSVEENHKTEMPSKEISKPMQNLTDKLRANPFILSTIVLGLFSLFLLIVVTPGGISGNVVSEEVAGNNLIEFLNAVADSEVTLVDVNDDGDFYEVIIEFKEQEMPFYVTKDGSRYASSLTSLVNAEQNDREPSVDVPKSDKPIVELFVMTHCPYGTQAEKGIIPTIKALGDTVDAKIRFVHYFMHEGEKQEPYETPIQVCIREEQPEKYLDYLECYLEDGDSDRCLIEVGIDQAKMNTCLDNGKADEYYAEDSGLSEDYGVQGSPTLVVNGVRFGSARDCSVGQQEEGECIVYSQGRSPSAYLNTICQAFNDVPEECNLELSSTTPSSMWGWDASGSSTTAQC